MTVSKTLSCILHLLTCSLTATSRADSDIKQFDVLCEALAAHDKVAVSNSTSVLDAVRALLCARTRWALRGSTAPCRWRTARAWLRSPAKRGNTWIKRKPTKYVRARK